MSSHNFPPLPLAEWQPTLETLQLYAQVIGKVRRALTPPHKHWYHISLRVGVDGLTTRPIPAGPLTFEIGLDLIAHRVVLRTSRGDGWQKALAGQSPAQFCEELLAALAGLGLEPEIDRTLFSDTTPGRYDRDPVERYFQAMVQIDALFKQFQGELREETSPVQLWPHHIDLAMLWFSGRRVPGTDPADEESSDEQMNFGFSPGDEGIPDPYFYITAYPTPDGWLDSALPEEAAWYMETFTGALLMYDSLVEAANPGGLLLAFLRTAQQAGARLMK